MLLLATSCQAEAGTRFFSVRFFNRFLYFYSYIIPYPIAFCNLCQPRIKRQNLFANAVLFLLRLFFPQTSVYFADKSAENFFFHLVVGKKSEKNPDFAISLQSVRRRYRRNTKTQSRFPYSLSHSRAVFTLF